MFKYVSFKKVDDAFTTHEFRGESEGVTVHHFDVVPVVSIASSNEDAIDALIASQSPLIECQEIDIDSFKSLVKNSAQYSRIKTVVAEKYNTDVMEITNAYPLHERETWAIQLEQAKAYKQSGDALDAPFLKTLADAEGGSIAEFAEAVILKSNAYEAFMANALANKRAHERELLSEFGL